jgi:hypothetical protein
MWSARSDTAVLARILLSAAHTPSRRWSSAATGAGMLARIQSSLESDTGPADARGMRLVLPPCVFCGAVNTSLVEQTRQFLFVGCPHCSYLFSMPKPQNDAAQH